MCKFFSKSKKLRCGLILPDSLSESIITEKDYEDFNSKDDQIEDRKSVDSESDDSGGPNQYEFING
jgi:hypothetical protein